MSLLLSSKSKQGKSEFVNEISIISGLQHPNLAKLHAVVSSKRPFGEFLSLKIQIFSWVVTREKYLTKEMLIKKRFITPDLLCLLCGQETKSSNHLLIHCSFLATV
uniref:Reverse transcriptase zinc-binding domain-containing protein n=1 Tax=Nelumbo nucifera TaxID=4432 RepID=A0A822XQA8_NELNU|nr:TPA_asm: hypothetical protein HUJ06_022378 [Nelumbo nucifera]